MATTSRIFIDFYTTDFCCPNCLEKYNDNEDKYFNRINNNKQGFTSIMCKCSKRFGMTYTITGHAIGFKL